MNNRLTARELKTMLRVQAQDLLDWLDSPDIEERLDRCDGDALRAHDKLGDLLFELDDATDESS